MRYARGLERGEWQRMRDRATQRVLEAREAAQDARARYERTRSRRASVEAARGLRVLETRDRDRVALLTLYGLGTRVEEHVTLRFETTEWLDDGGMGTLIRGKGIPRTREEIAAGVPPMKEERLGYLVPALAAELRAWVERSNPTGTLPTEGLVWAAGRPHHAGLSVDSLERLVHAIALEAGVQAYAAPTRDNPKPGRERKSHRFFVTVHTIRELSERAAMPEVGRDIAARVHGHSLRVQEGYYWKTGLDEARAVATARGI